MNHYNGLVKNSYIKKIATTAANSWTCMSVWSVVCTNINLNTKYFGLILLKSQIKWLAVSKIELVLHYYY